MSLQSFYKTPLVFFAKIVVVILAADNETQLLQYH